MHTFEDEHYTDNQYMNVQSTVIKNQEGTASQTNRKTHKQKTNKNKNMDIGCYSV